MENLTSNKFIKFLLVGGLNTIFGYSAYAFLIFIGLHYTLAVLVGMIFGVFFNFFTTGRLVFKNSKNHLIFKFFGTSIIIYFLNIGFLRIFDLYKCNMYIAGIILLLPMAIIAFILNKKFVFEK